MIVGRRISNMMVSTTPDVMHICCENLIILSQANLEELLLQPSKRGKLKHSVGQSLLN